MCVYIYLFMFLLKIYILIKVVPIFKVKELHNVHYKNKALPLTPHFCFTGATTFNFLSYFFWSLPPYF